MGVASHRSDRQLDVKESSSPEPDDRPAVLFGAALLPNRGFGPKLIAMFGDPTREVGRPDFLLSFSEPGDGAGVISGHRSDGVDGRQARQQLALVVLGTAREYGAIPFGQLKGR